MPNDSSTTQGTKSATSGSDTATEEIKRTHPDQGGSETALQEVRDAKERLLNDA